MGCYGLKYFFFSFFVAGLDNELFYVRDGVVNSYAMGFVVPVKADVEDLEFAWQSLSRHPVSPCDPQLIARTGVIVWALGRSERVIKHNALFDTYQVHFCGLIRVQVLLVLRAYLASALDSYFRKKIGEKRSARKRGGDRGSSDEIV